MEHLQSFQYQAQSTQASSAACTPSQVPNQSCSCSIHNSYPYQQYGCQFQQLDRWHAEVNPLFASSPCSGNVYKTYVHINNFTHASTFLYPVL